MIELSYSNAAIVILVWFATVIIAYTTASIYQCDRHIQSLQNHLDFMRRMFDEDDVK